MKNNVFVDKSLLGDNLAELFDWYRGSSLESNSLYGEYEKEATNFLSSKNGEFEKQFIIDLKDKSSYVCNWEKGAYVTGQRKKHDYFLVDAAIGFSNFCIVMRNVIQGETEPEPLKMERQASPPLKAWGKLPGNGVTTSGGGTF